MLFHPPGAAIPEGLETANFVLKPLRAAHVELDYDAVMEDPAMLRAWSQSSWPADNFTIKENLDDLERHEREHVEGSAFTFTVLSPGEDRCLGCIYINPFGDRIGADAIPLPYFPAPEDYVADICFWVRPSLIPEHVDIKLLKSFYSWIDEEWHFNEIFFHTSADARGQATLFNRMSFDMVASFQAESPRPGKWLLFKTGD